MKLNIKQLVEMYGEQAITMKVMEEQIAALNAEIAKMREQSDTPKDTGVPLTPVSQDQWPRAGALYGNQ